MSRISTVSTSLASPRLVRSHKTEVDDEGSRANNPAGAARRPLRPASRTFICISECTICAIRCGCCVVAAISCCDGAMTVGLRPLDTRATTSGATEPHQARPRLVIAWALHPDLKRSHHGPIYRGFSTSVAPTMKGRLVHEEDGTRVFGRVRWTVLVLSPVVAAATAVGFAFLSVEEIAGHDSVSAIFTGLATLGFAWLAALEFRTQGVSREEGESRLRREPLRTFAKRGSLTTSEPSRRSSATLSERTTCGIARERWNCSEAGCISTVRNPSWR